MAGTALLAIVAAGSFAIVFLGYMGLMGKLPPNRWAGIRTPFTRSSDENWYNTHRAAAPVMIFGGVLVLAVSMAFLPFSIAGRLGDAWAVGAAAACAVLTVITVAMGWYAGTSYAAARSTQGGKGE
jgi:uncharacterized membrane protein